MNTDVKRSGALRRSVFSPFATRLVERHAPTISCRKLGYSRPMKVAAYQPPLLPAGSFEAIALIQERVAWCESEGVSILCCPEAILGGLADYCKDPALFAIRTDDNQLNRVLAPRASDTVTSIIGFTELADD